MQRVLLLAACSAGLISVGLVEPCRAGVKVESPNGGESIPAKSRRPIIWSCDASVQQVMIEFSYTGGVFWNMVAPVAPCAKGKGSYLWTVPSISSPRCLIRVTTAGKLGGSDQSDAPFTIFPCALRMDYDGDCVITFADLAAFAQEWLRCGDPYDAMCVGNWPPQIISSPPAQTGSAQIYIYDVRAVDPDGDKLVYELLRGPAGMVIDPDSGRISWTSTADSKSSLAVIVQVRDELGAADVQAFDLGSSQTQSQQMLTGAPVGGYPSLSERRVIVYTNAIRMAPQQYRDKYMAGSVPDPHSILQTYTAVEPLYYEAELNASARVHAEDMGTNGCFQHDSCDGTAWSDRIRSYDPQARTIGENIGAGYVGAKSFVDGLLCDASGGPCALDKTSQAGHRTNIMSASFTVIGTGYAPDAKSTRRYYWVQDFAAGDLASRPPLVAGCHDFLTAGKTTFLLNYRDTTNQPPASLQVVIGAVAYNLALDLGTPAAGTYRLDVAKATACRQYYFQAVTASGQSWRYPGPGVFLTDGEGTCSSDYQ
ncbi:MAG: CAP domain-containing protein [Phycisphaerae bacterium]|nr:CAP domain-containing protein [Phycisphaerae bacterium]